MPEHAETALARPRGAEAQCPICNRIFGSDSTCEKHKPYARPVTTGCKDPVSLGMEIRVRRGGVVAYVRPMPSDVANLSRAGSGVQLREAGVL